MAERPAFASDGEKILQRRVKTKCEGVVGGEKRVCGGKYGSDTGEPVWEPAFDRADAVGRLGGAHYVGENRRGFEEGVCHRRRWGFVGVPGSGPAHNGSEKVASKIWKTALREKVSEPIVVARPGRGRRRFPDGGGAGDRERGVTASGGRLNKVLLEQER